MALGRDAPTVAEQRRGERASLARTKHGRRHAPQSCRTHQLPNIVYASGDAPSRVESRKTH